MPNIASALKEEIARVARKELRAEIDSLRKATSTYRREIAALKRRLGVVEKQTGKLAKANPASQVAEESEDADGPGLRFRADGLASHRKRLGLSAADFGKLVGVSGQSIYKWESGGARPRRSQMEAIAAVRKLSKTEATERLQSMA